MALSVRKQFLYKFSLAPTQVSPKTLIPINLLNSKSAVSSKKIQNPKMSFRHDPVHNALDMALRTLGGDKNAYKRYKRDKEREKALDKKIADRKKYRGQEDRSNFQSGRMISQHSNARPTGGLSALHASPNGRPFNAQHPSMYSGHQFHGLIGGLLYSSIHSDAAAPRTNLYSGHEGVPGELQHSSVHSGAVAPGTNLHSGHGGFPGGLQQSSSHSHVAALRTNMQSVHGRFPGGSQHGSTYGIAIPTDSSNIPSELMTTTRYPLGDMNRTYIEGMVPINSQSGRR